ncbi:hypothetical protein [Sinorhizobium medicae]|nr:hypothetical protein [Sinorhizobium medicae]
MWIRSEAKRPLPNGKPTLLITDGRSEAKRPLLNGKPTLLITDGAKFWSA